MNGKKVTLYFSSKIIRNQLLKTPSFRGSYVFLSNFYTAPISMYGVIYQTVEHAFQAAKTLDLNEREKIRQAKSSEVKQLGKKITLRSNWLIFRLEAMEELLRRKFSIPALKERLLSTGDLELIERNFWKDIFWGTCHGVEENNLGKLLMKIRKEFQEKDRMSF